MRAASIPHAIGLALLIAASSSQAVGFGRIINSTQLGQPLNFAAIVRLDPDDQLSRECVSAEVQSGDNKLQPQQVRVTLEGGADAAERRVRVTSSALIDEPVVTVSVTVGCTAKVTRRFVAFVDPPLIDVPRTALADAPLPPQRVDSDVSPILSIVQGADPGAASSSDTPAVRPRIRSTAVPATDDGATVATPSSRSPRRQASVAHRAHVAHAAASGPRLRLDAAPAAAPVVAAAPSAPAAAFPLPAGVGVPAAAVASSPAPASPVLQAATPPADAGSAADAVARDRQRLQALEDNMARMRSESQAAQAALAALQVRLQQAESDRYSNPMVYALAWLSAVLAVALAAFWWRQSRGRPTSQWWAGPGAAPGAAEGRLANLAEPVAVSAPQPLGAPITAADAFDVSTVVEDEEVPPAQVSLSTRPAPFVSSGLAPLTVSPEPPRELSVEELIDLEQQAEFFIVLGQDDAAIELLMNHVRSDGGISPLPYLKLLEIYRRLGDRESYQRIRERFNRRFNAYAPDWDADLQQGRTLADYPDTMVRLQALWASPGRVLETVDASLFRRNRTDETFDLPAYRELLFLYSVARDLGEHGDSVPPGNVDLLLPLGEPGEEPIARLSATTQAGELTANDLSTRPLDLDVSFDSIALPADAPTHPSALRRDPPPSNFIDFDLDTPDLPQPKTGKP